MQSWMNIEIKLIKNKQFKVKKKTNDTKINDIKMILQKFILTFIKPCVY